MRRWVRRACLVAVLSGLWLAGCQSAPAPVRRVSFTEVAVGVEYARVLESAATLDDTVFEGHAFRIHLEHAGVRLLPAGGPTVRREVATIVRSLHQVVAINGSFFDEAQQPMGAIVDQGRVLSRRRLQAWGALVVEGNQARIVPGNELVLNPPPLLALQGQPRLVVDGQVPGLKPQVARRTAVCAEGPTLLFVVATRPIEASAFGRFLAAPEARGGLACRNALNLDGGPSTQLEARLGEFSVSSPGNDGVPNALAALPGLPYLAPVLPRPAPKTELDDAHDGGEGSLSAP